MTFTVITNKIKEMKKFWITFVVFLFATIFIVSIFSLVANRDDINWLSTTSGLGREKMFPFVFTSNSNIYVMNEDLSIEPVDNDCTNVIYDADLNRVYYTHSDGLFEYEVDKKIRKELVSGVKSFYLFGERTDILYLDSENALFIYSYESKNSEMIRPAQSEYYTPSIGVNLFTYSKLNTYTNQYELICRNLDGDTYMLSNNQKVSVRTSIWKDDKAISFYENDTLKIFNLYTKKVEGYENASLVKPNNGNYYVKNEKQFADSYDSCTNYKYMIVDIDKTTGYGKLAYVTVGRNGLNFRIVDALCSGAVCYDEVSEVVLYKVPDGDNFIVTKSQKGSDGKALLTANSANTFMYEPNSCYLYYKTAKNEVYYIDSNDIYLKENLVSKDAQLMELYRNKPFAVITNNDETETIVLGDGGMITYDKSETRLYGNLDSKYFLSRTIGADGYVSLDYVEGESLKRITNSCLSILFFDKQMNNVIYWDNGKLYAYTNGTTTMVGEFEYKIVETLVVAKNK